MMRRGDRNGLDSLGAGMPKAAVVGKALIPWLRTPVIFLTWTLQYRH